MIDPDSDPATIVARTVSRRAASERSKFLRELLAHTAAGLVVLEGDKAAAEAVYRIADAVVARKGLNEVEPNDKRTK